jgi:tRNA threonylcarbamoyladenosine biosynthesis protein TsaB
MHYLLIESSTERGIVAILDGLNPVKVIELPFGLQNSRYLTPAVSELLSTYPVEAIAVGIGPGSYTGIRVAASFAKSLAYAKKLPLVGICSLDGFIPDVDGTFASILDAKIGGFYVLKGIKQNGAVTFTSKPALYDIKLVPECLKDVEIICSPNIAPLQKRLPSNSWTWLEKTPDPKQLAISFLSSFKKAAVFPEYSLELLYLRKTQAELERAEQNCD